MLITRWQAPLVPTIEQVRSMFLAEGLQPQNEAHQPKQNVQEHRHPFDEIRMVVDGEMHLNISGNQVLLRPGDRILIPSNTRHQIAAHGDTPCTSIYSFRSF